MMKWFRLYNEIIDDPKIRKLTDFQFKILIYTFALASEIDQEGKLYGYSMEDLGWRFRVRTDVLRKCYKYFIKLRILHEVVFKGENVFVVSNWNKRQYKSDLSTERVQKHRMMKRFGNVTETSP